MTGAIMNSNCEGLVMSKISKINSYKFSISMNIGRITFNALLWFIAALNLSFVNPLRKDKCNVQIVFENFVGDEVLQFDSVNYMNSLHQSFIVTKFKYYISNIRLKNMNGQQYISDQFFLVNEDEKKSGELMLEDIPAGQYEELSFTLGVDSLRNCSGLQSGALDPVNGMFWAWNTGYVFLKIEGRAPQSSMPGNIFEFHIGGFRQPNNCLKEISLPLNDWQITPAKTNSIRIKTDASEIFKTPIAADFSKLSSVTDFRNAKMIADNYADMFSILSVE